MRLARSFDPARDVALVAVFAALVAGISFIQIPMLPVPITLQTLGVALAGLVLGPWRGGAAVLLYIVAGLAGLPVFAGGSGGFGVLFKPSAGYLLAFPIGAFAAGWLAILARWWGRWLPITLGLASLAASFCVIHPAGIIGLMVNAKMGFVAAAMTDLLFWPGDILKSLLAGLIAITVHRAFPTLLPRSTTTFTEDLR